MSNGAGSQTVKTLQPGDFLCFQGEESNEIFVLRSGALNIYVVSSDGVATREKVETEGMLVGVVDKPGQFIGEIGAILRENRSASIRVSDDGPAQVMVINLRGKGFDATVMQNPKIGFSLSKTIAQRLADTSHSINRVDSLTLKAKGFLEENARGVYQAVNEIEKIASNKEEKIDLIEDAKLTRTYQIGRLIEKYGSLPVDFYGTIGMPFPMQTTMFKNRIFRKGAVAGNSPEVSGPPRQGVAAFNPGDVVCAEKSIDKNMYFLLGGKLEVFVGMRPLEIIDMKGAVFGENAMFGDMERSSSVRALTDVHAMPVPAGVIEPYLMKKPPLVLHTLKMFAKRLPILNEIVMKSAQEMSQIISFLGHGPEGCMTVVDMLQPRFKTELVNIGEDATVSINKLISIKEDLESGFDMINSEYDKLCQEIGYKPKEIQSSSVMAGISAPKFDFVTKIEELEFLDSEHINFVLNPKKDQFRACSIEFGHIDLLKQAKVNEQQWNDFVFGRIINYGDSFPSQFMIFDLDCAGTHSVDRDYILRSIKFVLERTEHEVSLLYKENNCSEMLFIPDHIKIEGEELVDENTINEIVEAFRKDPSDRDNLSKLNGLYWDLIINTVQKKLPRVKDNAIQFEDNDLELINFGLLDRQFIPENSNVLDQMELDKKFDPGEDSPLVYIYLSDLLQDVYKEAFGCNKLIALEEDKKKTEADFQNCTERIKILGKGRLDLVQSFPNGPAAAKFIAQYDNLVRGMAVLDRKMKSGKSISNEERAKIVQAKNIRNQLMNQISRYLTTIKGKVSDDQINQLRELGEELEKKVILDLDLHELVARKTQIINDHVKSMKSISIKQKETTYKNEMIRIKKYVLMTAKKAKVDSNAVLVNIKDIATKTRVKEIIDLFLEDNIDPQIFDPAQQRIKQLGIPRVMLVPGSGDAVYDWEKHLFIVPLIAPKTLEESIANAFVEFHWDMDEDKSMRESYGAIKIYKKLSITKLKQQLSKDYVIWATQESKGWKKLDKEVRSWFLVKIAKQKLDKS